MDKYNFSRKTLDGDCPLLTCDQKTGVTGLEWWPVSFGAQICQELSTACEGSGRRRASNCQSFDDSPSPCLRSAKTYRCQLDSSWLKSRWSLSCNGRYVVNLVTSDSVVIFAYYIYKYISIFGSKVKSESTGLFGVFFGMVYYIYYIKTSWSDCTIKIHITVVHFCLNV